MGSDLTVPVPVRRQARFRRQFRRDAAGQGVSESRHRRRIVEDTPLLWKIQGADMDDVAFRAGAMRRTLHGHFASPEELVMEVAGAQTAVMKWRS